MINLLVLSPNKTDSTSFYRSFGPLGHLRKTYGDKVNFIPADGMTISWAILGMVDVLFIQRPFTDNHLQIIKMAKENNVKVWVDYDDDLFNVPLDNPANKLYDNEETKKNVAMCCALADVVTTSTNHLKEALQPLNQNVEIIPNALNEKLFSYGLKRQEERNNLILWRGSNTHERDIRTYEMAIKKGILNNDQYSWVFVGYNPWYITGYNTNPRVMAHDPIDVIEFHKVIYNLKPAAIHVPLHDSEFNRSKSNIAMIEAAFAGAVCIAPNWEEWNLPGVLNYENEEMYEHFVGEVTNDKQYLKLYAKQNWEYVLDNLTLEKVNPKRMKLLTRLMDE